LGIVHTQLRRLALVLVSALATACGGARAASAPPIVQPGAPGQESKIIDAPKAADLSKVGATDADVKFMQGMIHHHQQALEMVALIPTHSARDDMKLLGKRIELSQDDEIKMMKRWLQVRGQALPDEHAMHMPGATLMPGMLSHEEMEHLAASKGDEFDRLFLQGMMKHHGGAITMVNELFATPGAGQEVEIFSFASDVDADQRMEIDRMGAMLTALGKEHQR
jgi:uncharacterized protein (DUF305 family)